MNNGDNLNNFVIRQMNLSWGEVEKQLEQRWETDESVLGEDSWITTWTTGTTWTTLETDESVLLGGEGI
ncbi:MAG: hypothetical protein EGR49_00550 [Prevotella sp.]|nr:hypothetical protein [Prevotella sp.]